MLADRRRLGFGLGAGLLVLALGSLAGPAATTYAAWSDVQVVHNSAGAGVWAPDPPATCGPITQYTKVVYGTPSDDVLVGGNKRQILMGLGGNDTIRGGNAGDCLVGGDGDDKLYEGNGKDTLDGGAGRVDTCLGGNGKNVLVSCETVAP
jgi:Ca2+-binding RTX toxin-like protein